MRGTDRIDSQYHKRMEARERELREMTERKERMIEQRIAAENGVRNRATKRRKADERDQSGRDRYSVKAWQAKPKTTASRSIKHESGKQRPIEQRATESRQEIKRSRQAAVQPKRPERRVESRPVYLGEDTRSRTERSGDNSRTFGRVIRTVVILYIVFGLFAGIVPRVVGNLGEFVTDMRDEFFSPQPEPGYEVVTEEAIVEEIKEDHIFLRTDSVDFIVKTNDWVATLDEAQSYLAFEYSPDAEAGEGEGRLLALQEMPVYEIEPPESMATYWDFFLQEYDWTVMMMTKAAGGESIAGDFEQLNLLQYDKFAELVRVWNQEGVEYEVSFRQYDYQLIPRTE